MADDMTDNITDNMTEVHAPDSLSREQREAVEAAVFRRLVAHLRKRVDVQNIDLMDLSGFCRNCLSKWFCEEAKKDGVALDYEAVRREIYDMPYAEWKERYQK